MKSIVDKLVSRIDAIEQSGSTSGGNESGEVKEHTHTVDHITDLDTKLNEYALKDHTHDEIHIEKYDYTADLGWNGLQITGNDNEMQFTCNALNMENKSDLSLTDIQPNKISLRCSGAKNSYEMSVDTEGNLLFNGKKVLLEE